MAIENYQNLNKVEYFDLEKYINNISLNSYVLEHLQETSNKFDKYFKNLLKYDSYAVIQYLIFSFYKEYENSQAIESHYINSRSIMENDIYFERLNISHNRIHELNNFVRKEEGKELNNGYRKVPVRVSKVDKTGEEFIFWHGPEPEYVKRFMDDFIKIYKQSNTSLLDSNPFLKSSLIQLLFIRIHPYTDGNGRTARLIHNIKFTDSINRIYGMKLKLCPLNLSASILINKITYAKRLNSIYFDLENDTNDEINNWFDFMLNMFDEQIYYNSNKINEAEESLINLEKMKDTDSNFDPSFIEKMKIKHFK